MLALSAIVEPGDIVFHNPTYGTGTSFSAGNKLHQTTSHTPKRQGRKSFTFRGRNITERGQAGTILNRMHNAGVASAANGIARRLRRPSSWISSHRLAGSQVHADFGTGVTSCPAPRLVRCRSLASATAFGGGGGGGGGIRGASSRCAHAASISPSAEYLHDMSSSDASGRFLAGAAALAICLSGGGGGEDETITTTTWGNDKSGGGGALTSSRGDIQGRGGWAGGSTAWCKGRTPTPRPLTQQQHRCSSDGRRGGGEGDTGSGVCVAGEVVAEKQRADPPLPQAADNAAAFRSRFTPAVPPISSVRITDIYRFDGEPVGVGQRATVSTATHLRTGQPVAVKRLSRAETTRLEAMEEVNLLKVAGRHPNVVSLQAFFEDQEAYYIVMEMCEGGELYQSLADKGRYSEGQAARIMAELASAVAFLHMNMIVHFDLKPENIMLAVGGDDCVPDVRLADFGSAFWQYRHISSARGFTAAYSAPEVLARQAVDEKVDMWALGCVMWLLLTGRHPFGAISGLSEMEVAKRVAEVEPDIRVLRHVSPEGKDLVRRLLARDPEDRPSAQQLLSHPWLRAVVTRGTATTSAKAASSRSFIRRKQQQSQQRHAATGGAAEPGAAGALRVEPPLEEQKDGEVAGDGQLELAPAAATPARPGREQQQQQEHMAAAGGGRGASGAEFAKATVAAVASVTGDHLSASA